MMMCKMCRAFLLGRETMKNHIAWFHPGAWELLLYGKPPHNQIQTYAYRDKEIKKALKKLEHFAAKWPSPQQIIEQLELLTGGRG